MRPTVYIGCAGWSISSLHADHPALGQEGSHLLRYAAALPAVEINSSFYRPHRPETYARWRDTTPDTFRFSVKIPKTITHEKKLIGIDEELARFVGETALLGEKLGCLLLQLPPRLAFDQRVASAFFDLLRAATPVRIMCEPRHPSWFADDATSLLAAHRITRVIADPPIVGVDHAPLPVSDAVYIRLHGSPEMYWSAYSDAYLEKLAAWIDLQLQAGLQVWCVFDNTAAGAALADALSLQARMQTAPANGRALKNRSSSGVTAASARDNGLPAPDDAIGGVPTVATASANASRPSAAS